MVVLLLPVHPTPGAPPAARVAPVTAPTAAPHLLTPYLVCILHPLPSTPTLLSHHQ